MTNHTVNASIIYDQPTNVTSAPEFFFSYLNNQSDGTWGLTLVGLSFGIPMIALSDYNPRKAFAAASFNTMITAVILTVFGVVDSFVYTLGIVLVAIAVLINRGGGK